MQWLAGQGIDDVVYCIAHQGEQIRRYWASEPAPVRSLRYVDEGTELRGTGGALRLALEEGVLDEWFFVLYGDSFLPVEFEPVLEVPSKPATACQHSPGCAQKRKRLLGPQQRHLRWRPRDPLRQECRPADAGAHAVYRLWVVGGAARCNRGNRGDRLRSFSSVSASAGLEGQLAGYEVKERFLRRVGRLKGCAI